MYLMHFSISIYKHKYAQKHVQQHTSMLFTEDHEHAGTVEFAMLGSSLALNLLPSWGYRQHTEMSQDVRLHPSIMQPTVAR